jgi:hypothetical protein
MNLYHLYSLSQQAIIRRDMPHPRADEGAVVDMDPDLALLRVVIGEQPEHDPLTHTPAPIETIDLAAGECRVTWELQPVADDLAARRAQMAEILDALPTEVQAALWPVRVSVEQALDRGRLDIARQIVLTTPIPPELEQTKAAILDLFPAP